MLSSRTNAIVVETSNRSDPCRNSANWSMRRDLELLALTVLRRGGSRRALFAAPGDTPSRGCRPGAGRRESRRPLRRLIGMSNRVRNSRSSFSFSFFCWWVTLRPSPASPEAVAFDCLGEDHRGSPPVSDGGLVGGIDLLRIVAAAEELADLFVGEVVDHFAELGVACRRSVCGYSFPGSTEYFW